MPKTIVAAGRTGIRGLTEGPNVITERIAPREQLFSLEHLYARARFTSLGRER